MKIQKKSKLTPWKVNKRSVYNLFGGKRVHNFQIETSIGEPVALLGTDQEATAQLIVRAVNGYDEALAMLKHLVSLDSDDTDNLEALKESARELIAKAEGGKV